MRTINKAAGDPVPAISSMLKAFSLWYLAFGTGASFPMANGLFFTRPPQTWDSLHCAMLALAGLFALNRALWALTAAYHFPTRAAAIAVALQMGLVTCVVAWLQLSTGMFSSVGLLAFSVAQVLVCSLPRLDNKVQFLFLLPQKGPLGSSRRLPCPFMHPFTGIPLRAQTSHWPVVGPIKKKKAPKFPVQRC